MFFRALMKSFGTLFIAGAIVSSAIKDPNVSDWQIIWGILLGFICYFVSEIPSK